MKNALKWSLLIAMIAIIAAIAVEFASFVLIGIFHAGSGISDWTTQAVWSIGEIFIGLANLFLFKFVILTAIYLTGLTAIVALIYWIILRLSGKPRETFRALWKAALMKLSDNNVRWLYLAIMTILTLILGVSYPGTPLLQSSIKEL